MRRKVISISETSWKGTRYMTRKNYIFPAKFHSVLSHVAANSHSETFRTKRGDVPHPQIYVRIYVCKENGDVQL